MIVEKVSVNDYLRIAKEHKIFIWHFLQKKQCNSCLTFYSYFDTTNSNGRDHVLKMLIDEFKIPYFESYTSESIDFLVNNGLRHKHIWNSHTFAPIILGFKDGVQIAHTGQLCYCVEGLARIITKLDLSVLEKVIQ